MGELSAAGRQENESYQAEDPSGVDHTIDTSGRVRDTAKKHNIYLEAKDKGGNTTVAGPYNISIDPESDLPIVSIINPRAAMHVQGNLNIVGTCTDDDGVARVDVWFNDDERSTVTADGTDFWLSDYDTTQLPDTIYSISAQGTDITGVTGRVKRVEWHLDRKKPEITITSHESGALVSGKIALRGQVWDGNGVAELEYSVDNGASYHAIKLQADKQPHTSRFEAAVDTRRFVDGSTVVEFRARDRLQTEGVRSFLLLVNNTPPEVGITYPAAEAAVNGVFTVAGYATHPVGVASLQWTLGEESGELPLIVGNPWWVQQFDIRGLQVTSLDLSIRAEDLSGNVTVTRRKLRVDQGADLPEVELREPAAGAMFSENGLTVSGVARDNTGIAAVLYSLNGGAAVETACTSYFQLVLPPPALTGERHTLAVWARDQTGVEGRPTVIKDLVNPGPPPRLTAVRVSEGTGQTATVVSAFHAGITVNNEAGQWVEVEIASGSPLERISYQVGSQEAVEAAVKRSTGGTYIQRIPVTAESDYGLVQVRCTAIDSYERTGTLEEYIFVTNFSARPVEAEHEPVNKLRDGPLSLEGLNGLEHWPRQLAVAYGRQGTIAVRAAIDEQVAVKQVTVSVGEGAAIPARVRGGVIEAGLPADLPVGLHTVTVRAAGNNGEVYTVTGEVWILRPAAGRQVNMAESFTVLASASAFLADGRIVLERGQAVRGLYMFNGRPLQRVELSGDGAEALSVRLDDDGLVRVEGSEPGSYGPVTLTLTNIDDRVFRTEQRFLVLDAAPDLTVRGPENIWVQETAAVTVRSETAPWLASLEYSTDLGASWQPFMEASALAAGAEVTRQIDLSGLPDGSVPISVRATDIAGRAAERTVTVSKDTEAPEATVAVPLSGASVNGIIRLGMPLREAGRIAAIRYEHPGIPATETEPGRAPISRVVYEHTAGGGELPMRFCEVVMDTATMPLAEEMRFVFTDLAGNSSELSEWDFVIDHGMDLPVTRISLPVDNEVITADFTVSGVCFDDDEVRYLHWRIDDEPEQVQATRHSYTLPIAVSGLRDNEHTVTVYLEDIYGVHGPEATRRFRVSREEPFGVVMGPGLGEIVGGTVDISGVADDRNGIKRVQVSLDNGNTFNDAEDTLDWRYTVNTKILSDGPNILFIQIYDEYEISAMYASMLIVDNTPPELSLDTPRDGMSTNGILSITGNSRDNIMLESIQVQLSSLEGVAIPEELALREVPVNTVLWEELDLSGLPGGQYNVEIGATDKARNVTALSRNITLAQEAQLNFVDILYPLNGEYVQGTFNLYGYVSGVDTATEVTLTFNGGRSRSEPLTAAGYFRFSITEADLAAGANTLVVRGVFGGKQPVESAVRTIWYEPAGPWVTVDTMTMGDFAYDRPWLMGRAGYVLNGTDQAVLADTTAAAAARAAVTAKKLDVVELSFDNGSTFVPVKRSGGDEYDWKYRLEDGDMRPGVHYLLVRASMANGETAVTRLLVQVDKTPPEIRLFTPENGGRYNHALTFAALAGDDNELNELTYYLRVGDKAAYEIPGFIQGLYFEGIIPPFIRQLTTEAPAVFVGGATYTDFGMGLSFFDDNVKIQVQYGFITQELFTELGGEGDLRYGGNVLGLKLLANMYTLPFATVLGPDWEWLFASIGVGANFSLFDIAREGYTQSGNPSWMSALLAQLEFPKVTLPKRQYLRTFSLFTEGQLWFVPTDVDAAAFNLATIIPHVIVGLRLYIF